MFQSPNQGSDVAFSLSISSEPGRVTNAGAAQLLPRTGCVRSHERCQWHKRGRHGTDRFLTEEYS